MRLVRVVAAGSAAGRPERASDCGTDHRVNNRIESEFRRETPQRDVGFVPRAAREDRKRGIVCSDPRADPVRGSQLLAQDQAVAVLAQKDRLK